MKVLDFLDSNSVVIDLKSNTKQEVITELRAALELPCYCSDAPPPMVGRLAARVLAAVCSG